MGLFDRFKDPEKIRLENEAREVRRAEEEDRRRREQAAEKIREEEMLARAEWRYRENVDEMRGTITSFAELTSENSVDMSFPYNGGSNTVIAIRKNPDRSREVLIMTLNGQYDSHLNGYNFSMKIDKAPVAGWTAMGAADGSSNVMFVSNAAAFIRSIAKSDRVIIELPFYNNGRQQFIFNTAGLDRRFT